MARRRRKLPRWLDQPVYWGIRAAVGAMLTAPVGSSIRSAQSIGRWIAQAPFNSARLARAQANLAVAFPDWSGAKRRQYAIKAYEHLCMLAVESAYSPRLVSDDAWSNHIRLGDLRDSVPMMLAGRPCVLITGHCGSWELLGYSLALLGFPVHALYRPLDLAPLDAWVRQTRQRRGLVLVDKFGAASDLPRLVGQGALPGFVADQNAGDKGLFVPFFGRLASSYKSIGLIALHNNAPILCGQARRLVWERDGAPGSDPDSPDDGHNAESDRWTGGPFRYRIDLVDTIRPEDWADQPDPLFYVTARYRRAIETMVRRAPEQYLWMHRYWKSRPRHERRGRPMPSSLRHKIEQLPWMTPPDVERVLAWSERDSRELAAGARANEEAETSGV